MVFPTATETVTASPGSRGRVAAADRPNGRIHRAAREGKPSEPPVRAMLVK
jgi:hypothetical protein